MGARSGARSRVAFWRLPFLAGAALALLAGLYGGLALLVGELPAAGRAAEHHGPLMALGFLGTLICLERAVALGRGWAYAAPALGLLGGLALLAAPAGPLGPLALTAAAGWLVAVYLTLLLRRPGWELLPQVGGAAAWYAGGLLWLAGGGVPDLVPWLAAFLVLTIAGERLELARVAFLTGKSASVLSVMAAVIGVGAVVSAWNPDLGWRVCGAGMLATAVWLARYDVARRTVRGSGLPRYAAVCLLAGYAWLAVAGVLWTAAGLPPAAHVYDAALHALFLGFVMSMVFGHAPVILPAVLRVRLPYRRVLYAPLALLHGGLAVRVLGDLAGSDSVRTAGGLLTLAALLVFAGCVALIGASPVRRRR
ncbi:hypothetical protein [Streptosporangium sp. NPDC000396]|uniref:hypothetical protein n=1 Tax=Streptosporangium sp. NPDC000396 TaxID=3366185 RepID=UPI0036964097